MTLFLLWRESGSGRRPARFRQNEIPLKNSVESRDCAHPKVTGQNAWRFLLGHGRRVPAISIIGTLPDRDRRYKPGDEESAAPAGFALLPAIDLTRSAAVHESDQNSFQNRHYRLNGRYGI